MNTRIEFLPTRNGHSFLESLVISARGLVPAMRLALDLVSRDMLVKAGSFGFGPRFSHERFNPEAEFPETEKGLGMSVRVPNEKTGKPEIQYFHQKTLAGQPYGEPERFYPLNTHIPTRTLDPTPTFTATSTTETSTSNR